MAKNRVKGIGTFTRYTEGGATQIPNNVALKDAQNTFTAIQTFNENIRMNQKLIKNLAPAQEESDALSMWRGKQLFKSKINWTQIINHTQSASFTNTWVWTSSQIPTGVIEVRASFDFNGHKWIGSGVVLTDTQNRIWQAGVITTFKSTRSGGYPNQNPPLECVRMSFGILRDNNNKVYLKCLDNVPANYGNISHIEINVRKLGDNWNDF